MSLFSDPQYPKLGTCETESMQARMYTEFELPFSMHKHQLKWRDVEEQSSSVGSTSTLPSSCYE